MIAKKAKILKFFLLLFYPYMAVYGNPIIPQSHLEEKIDMEPHEDELITTDRMIRLTKKQLEAQERLKILINEIRRNKELFLKGESSKLHAYYMIQAAKESLSIIRAFHLEHLFSSDFMEELALFNQVGTRE